MSPEIRFGRDPLFEHFEQHVDDLMDHLLRRSTPASYQRAWAPHVDVYETAVEFVLVCELAGVDADAVQIEIDLQEIAISGERSVPVERLRDCAGAQPLQLEIPFGPFERRLVLPVPVDGEKATASFEDGMLTARLPKVSRKPRRVQVDVE